MRVKRTCDDFDALRAVPIIWIISVCAVSFYLHLHSPNFISVSCSDPVGLPTELVVSTNLIEHTLLPRGLEVSA